MSVVAPARNTPTTLRFPKWGNRKAKTVEFPFEEPPATPLSPPLSPTIPNKSPNRPNFFPSPILTSEEKKNIFKSTPSSPTNPSHSHSLSLSSTSIARSNTRFSNVSTAVGTASTGRGSPSSGPLTAPLPLSASHPASSPPKRAPTLNTTTSAPPQTRPRSQSTTSQPRRPHPDTISSAPTRLPTSSTRQKLTDQSQLSPSDTTQNLAAKQPPTTTQRLREGAFFAFVLLPLSCWYTRGGKRLKELDLREVEEGREARARANGILDGRANEHEEMEMRMPPRAAIPGPKVGRRMSFDSAPGKLGREGARMQRLSSDDLGMKSVKTFASEQKVQTPDFRKRSRFDVQRRSFDEGANGFGRRRADSWGAADGKVVRSRSFLDRQHPDFDFEVERVPLVRRTTTASAIIRELTPGRAV